MPCNVQQKWVYFKMYKDKSRIYKENILLIFIITYCIWYNFVFLQNQDKYQMHFNKE